MALTPFKKALLSSTTGAGVSRPLESALEAGGVYNDAIARGLDEDKANQAADYVFKKNLKLADLDAARLVVSQM